MDRQAVVDVHANACCTSGRQGFQISADVPPARSLSAQHSTEAQAWKCAATRLRIERQAHDAQDSNKELVLQAHPDAYCHLRGGRHQIRRARGPSDKTAHVRFVPLSGRYSVEEFAWQEAANRIRGVMLRDSAVDENMNGDAPLTP